MDKFFSWVWRINGLLILCVSLLIVGRIGFDLLETHAKQNQPSEPTVTNIAADPDGIEKWVLGVPRKISGSDFEYVRLESENTSIEPVDNTLNMFGSDEKYISKEAKNILFLNRKEETAKWLFEDIHQLIVSIGELPDPYSTARSNKSEQPSDAISIIYSVITKDINGDGLVDDSDESALAVSDVDGTNYNVILEGFERNISTELLDEDTIAILYQKSGKVYSRKYSLKTHKSISEFELPSVGR